jgi:outer membrane immunogenic protein
MRTIILTAIAACAALATNSATRAADMPVKAPVPAPAVAVYSWTGFYIGAHVGGGWIHDTDTVGDPLPSPATYGFQRIVIPGDGSGVVGGGQIGYNWQVVPSFLLGIEADFSGSGVKADGRFGPPIPSIPPGASYEAGSTGIASRDVDWMASVRGRIGFTADRFLAYITGGAAWARIKYSADEIFLTGVSNPGSVSSTKTGWVAGGGLEYAWTNNWSVRVEYLHYDFQGATFTGARVPTLATFGVQYTADRTQIDVVRAGLNYRFGGPVVARY